MSPRRLVVALCAIASCLAGCSGTSEPEEPGQDAGDTGPDAGDTEPDAGDTEPDAGDPSDGGAQVVLVPLPEGADGIAFDDLSYSEVLGKVVVAAGSTGRIDLVDPDTLGIDEIEGLDRPTSAAEGAGWVFAVDRGAHELAVADPGSLEVVVAVPVDGADYVRFAEPTSEAWVTEPSEARIEVFSVPSSGTPVPTHEAFVPIDLGPEGIAIDAAGRRAYVHRFDGSVVAVDLDSRSVVETWEIGCDGAHGLPAVDSASGLLFAGCRGAEAVVLDTDDDGAIVDHHPMNAGETLLAFAPELRHLYLRGDPGGTVVILRVAANGTLDTLGEAEVPTSGHCLAADDRGHAWTADAETGSLVRIVDAWP